MASLLHSYKLYKAAELNLYIKYNYDDNEHTFDFASEALITKRSSFMAKLKGSFYAIAGNLSTPGYNPKLGMTQSEESSYTTKSFSGPINTKSESSESLGLKLKNWLKESHLNMNHGGLYDWATLGIPYVLEFIVRGNWSSNPNTQLACKVFFSTLVPILPVLFLARNLVGLVLAIPTFFITGAIHLGEMAKDAYDARQAAKQQQEELEKPFLDSYSEFKKALNPEKYAKKHPVVKAEERPVMELESLAETAELRTSKALEAWNQAKRQAQDLTENNTNKYKTRFNKINQNKGKYGTAEAIEAVVRQGMTK